MSIFRQDLTVTCKSNANIPDITDVQSQGCSLHVTVTLHVYMISCLVRNIHIDATSPCTGCLHLAPGSTAAAWLMSDTALLLGINQITEGCLALKSQQLPHPHQRLRPAGIINWSATHVHTICATHFPNGHSPQELSVSKAAWILVVKNSPAAFCSSASARTIRTMQNCPDKEPCRFLACGSEGMCICTHAGLYRTLGMRICAYAGMCGSTGKCNCAHVGS